VLLAPQASADPRSRLTPQARAAAPGPRLLSPLAYAAGTPSWARLAFPRRDLPRPLLLRAARAAGSYCVSLRAPQARGPDGCSSVSGPPRRLVWLMPRHIRHLQPVCSRGYVAKKRGCVAMACTSVPPQSFIIIPSRRAEYPPPRQSRYWFIPNKRRSTTTTRVCRVERLFGRIFSRTLACQRSAGFDRAVNGRMDCLVMSSGLVGLQKGLACWISESAPQSLTTCRSFSQDVLRGGRASDLTLDRC